MMCQNCGKNEANVKYTQIINGVKKQMNLCSDCARRLGIDDMAFSMPSINFSNFLGGMFDGAAMEDFIESGEFGCDECYDSFSNQIDALLKNIHGVNRHVGRASKTLSSKSEKTNKNIENKKKENKPNSKLQELQARLKQEISEERYEDAAKTRDEIKKLGKEE